MALAVPASLGNRLPACPHAYAMHAIVNSRPTMANLRRASECRLSLLIDRRNECHDKD